MHNWKGQAVPCMGQAVPCHMALLALKLRCAQRVMGVPPALLVSNVSLPEFWNGLRIPISRSDLSLSVSTGTAMLSQMNSAEGGEEYVLHCRLKITAV